MLVNMVLWLLYKRSACEHALMSSGRIRHICSGRNLSSVVKHALYLAGFEGYAREREKTRAGTLFVLCRTQFSVLHIAHSTPRL